MQYFVSINWYINFFGAEGQKHASIDLPSEDSHIVVKLQQPKLIARNDSDSI